MNASVRERRTLRLHSITFAGMTSADTSAASFDPSLAEPQGWSLRKVLAPFAVGLALLSAFLTFVVLTGLTRI
jgi:two-component system nitrogen regulation sensor histidine kinase NtrY